MCDVDAVEDGFMMGDTCSQYALVPRCLAAANASD